MKNITSNSDAFEIYVKCMCFILLKNLKYYSFIIYDNKISEENII